MHLQCPHCRNEIETVETTLREQVACPDCGSSFKLQLDATTDWKPLANRTLNRFELLGVVGQGAFGTVYRARDAKLGRVVAIKVPRAGTIDSPDTLDRFLREARSVAQLRHPSIVTVHEVDVHEGLPYLVSDFIEGVTLADLLSARRPNPREAAEICAAAAEALDHAHRQGVVHRDVKPSNIMIEKPSGAAAHGVRIMDFGLAKRDTGEVTMTVDGEVIGTPAYMAPEQARGESHYVDGRSDVYSLCVVLYQTLTGELPFRGTTRMLLYQVLHDEPRPPRSLNDHVPRDLQTICLKAMAKEKHRRYPSAAALADDLRRFLRGEGIRARPVGFFARGWRWCRRYPLVASLVATIVLIAAGRFAGARAGRQACLQLRRPTAHGDDA